MQLQDTQIIEYLVIRLNERCYYKRRMHIAHLNVDDPKHATVANNRILDIYFSADVETDGPIPGPFSLLSFAFVFAGVFDGQQFLRPPSYEHTFYSELKPI